MNFPDWFKGSTPLQLAIERGLKPEGNLVAELDQLDDYTVKSKGDAKAICVALQALDHGCVDRQKHGKSPLYALAGLFQDAENGSDACDYLREHGTQFLIVLARKTRADERFEQSELLFVLKMLAAYRTSEGARLIIEIAKQGFAREQYLWSVVMGMFTTAHPEARRVFAALSDPVPDGFLAISLLDAANRFFLDGGEMRHPFDSDQGIRKLEAWLKNSDPEHFSYATSATAALPFIQHQKQHQLFQAAFEHPDALVQLEAAWAAAKMERPGGLEKLVALCKDVNHVLRAKSYLSELGREDVVPEESKLPDFEAKAEFAQWLAHPNELARLPDELEILDHRDLIWPIDGKTKHFWLIKYRVRDTTELKNDDVGVGLVGSITFCLFSYNLEQRPPEDAYAIHCYWEMTSANRITDSDVAASSEYDSLLHQWNGHRIEDAKIIAVSELSPEANYPSRLVGLASAKMNGQPGWAVLDGAESKWYPANETPADSYPKTALMVHIGRRLLGFNNEPDRKRFLRALDKLPPSQIERAYEKLLLKAGGNPSQRLQLLGDHGLLGDHFEAYVSARLGLHGGKEALHVIETYERFLKIAWQHPEDADKLFDSFAAIGKNFDQYINALLKLERQLEIIPLVELLAPHWQHNLGYGTLARAAFKAGRDDIAEKFCLQLKNGLEDWQRSEEMSHLAEIWHRHGKNSEACSLLVECMQKMLEEARKTEGSDRKFFEDHFQQHRSTFIKLFPSEPLGKHGLPETTYG